MSTKDEDLPTEVEAHWPRRPAHMFGWDQENGMYVRARMAPDGSIYARTIVEPFRGVEVTPHTTGTGATVQATAGTLYGADMPATGPVVHLLDDGGLMAILLPGVVYDFTARPRQFAGALTALALSAIGATAILLDIGD